MESRGRGRGRARGRSGGRGRGRGGRRGGYNAGGAEREAPRQRYSRTTATAETPVQKELPRFVKIRDITPGKNFDIVVKVESIVRDATRQEKRHDKIVTTTCTEALVGDETGCIAFSTRVQDKVADWKEGGVYVLLNARMRRITGERSWLDVDNWGAVKPVSECSELLPPNFNSNFEIDKASNRTHKVIPKPNFINVKDLEPEQKGLHLLVKVVSVKFEERMRSDGRPTKVADAVVGDESARINLIARAQNAEKLKEGAVVGVINAHIEMYNKGYMRLIADRWSDIKLLEEVDSSLLPTPHITTSSTVGNEDKSAQEWVLETS